MLWPNGSKTRPTITPRGAFGNRIHPLTGRKKLHRGTDFVGFHTVHAIAAGAVVVVGSLRGWTGGGRMVWVQHDGFFTRYLHLDSTTVKVGERVTEGRILGVMGATGAVTGVHLHLELTLGSWRSRNSGQIDPVPYIEARLHSTTGGNSLPPIPIIQRKEPDMATGVIYTDDKNDKDRSGAIVNTESGLFSAFGYFPKAYANNLAKGFGLTRAGEVTRGQYDQIRKDMAELRTLRNRG